MGGFLVESALLTHGLASVTDETLLDRWPAGMDCIAVTWGFRTRQALLEAGATVLADTPEQLLDLLQGSETPL